MRQRHFRWIGGGFSGGLLLLVAAGAAASAAWGATYNFYFNTTEQGDNAQATPTVFVGPSPQPGAVFAPPPTEPAAAPAPRIAPIDPPVTSQSVAGLPDPSPSVFRSVRLTFAAAGLWRDFDRPYRWAGRKEAIGGLLGLRAFLSRGVALSGYVSAYPDHQVLSFLGADLELVPLRLSVGKREDLIEGAILLGGSTLDGSGGAEGTLHGGARLSLNFGTSWGLTAAARANERSVLVEAGLVVRL